MRRETIIAGLMMAMGLLAGAARAENYALLVGVGKYESPNLRPLEFAEDDVVNLYRALRDGGYEAENMVALSPRAGARNPRFFPSAKNVRREFELLLSQLHPDDTLLIGLAGHGVQFKGESESFFCPADANLEDRTTLISIHQYLYKLLDDPARCKARERVVLIDACRDHPLLDSTRGRLRVELESVTRPQEVEPRSISVFFSCSAGERAFEDRSLKGGVFFHYVVQGLGGAADFDQDRQVSLSELQTFAIKPVSNFVRHTFAAQQTPQIIGEQTGGMILARLPQTRPPAESAPPAMNDTATKPPPVGERFQLELGGVRQGDLPPGWTGGNNVGVYQFSGVKALSTSSADPQQIESPPLSFAGDWCLQAEAIGKMGVWTFTLLDEQMRSITFQLRAIGGNRMYSWYLTMPDGNRQTIAGGREMAVIALRRDRGMFQVAVNSVLAATHRESEFGALSQLVLGFDSPTLGMRELKIEPLAATTDPPLMQPIQWTARSGPQMTNLGTQGDVSRWLWQPLRITGDFRMQFRLANGEGKVDFRLLGAQGGLDAPFHLQCRGQRFGNVWTGLFASGKIDLGQQRTAQTAFTLERRGDTLRLLAAGQELAAQSYEPGMLREFCGLEVGLDSKVVLPTEIMIEALPAAP